MSTTTETLVCASEYNLQVDKIEHDATFVKITWSSGQTSHFHNIWLRDYCQCTECFHPVTKQRLHNTFAIPEDIHAESVVPAGTDKLRVTWSAGGHVSEYDLNWLALHSYDPILVPKTGNKSKDKSTNLDKKLWDTETIKADLPTVQYEDVMKSDDGVKEWTRKIYVYGFCFVEGVPVNPEDTEKLVERLAYVRPTHYGGFWDFTADLAKHDTAYTNLALATHTDGTYWTDTPGLQLFHLLHHDGSGGHTPLVDTFYCAEVLKRENPAHYELLSNIRIPAHSAGDENVCIIPETPEPIFNHDPVTGELNQVRWNNDDRSTMDIFPGDPKKTVLEFYQAIRHWKDILTRPEHEFIKPLRPGTCLIFDNWRVLHGRTAYDGSRRMCGAYVNRDDYLSRFKLLNFGRDEVLKNL